MAIVNSAAMDMCTLSRFGHVWLFVMLWTVAHQASLSMGFYRQEYWSGLPCPPPGDLPDSGTGPVSLTSPVLAGVFFTIKAICCCSVSQSCLTLCNPMDCSTPGFPVLHHLPELEQNHVHWVGDGIQPSYPLSSPSPPAYTLSQNQGLFQWFSSLPKYWSFSFSISPSKEYSGLISFRIDWFDILQSKELSRISLNTTVQKHYFFGT